MKARLPATLAVISLGSGCSSPSPQACVVVPVPDAGVRTYECADGRACDAPDPSQTDGGIYQICPGVGECALLVAYDGTSMPGFC